MYEAASNPKPPKANTTGKSNISPGDGENKSEREEKKRMKWSAGYFHKVQECWDKKTVLAIDSNRCLITYLKEHAVIIGMPHPTLYI